ITMEATYNSDANLRSSELRTFQILGYPVRVVQSEPRFKVEVIVKSLNFDLVGNPDPRVACTLFFTCPEQYPRASPTVRIARKRNFPDFLEMLMLTEFGRLKCSGRGRQQIVRMVTKARAMVEQMARQMKRELRLFQDAEELGME
ncbi:hypothetical protein KR074_002033, partial [Drosophila pseudoananassae]